MTERNFCTATFHYILCQVSERIPEKKFKKMKFLVRDDHRIEIRTLERCREPYNLFEHLIDIGFISEGDTTELEKILDDVKCHNESAVLRNYAKRPGLFPRERWLDEARNVLEDEYRRQHVDDEKCALGIVRSASIFPDGGSDSLSDIELNAFMTELTGILPIRLDGPSANIRSNSAKRIAKKWAQGGLNSFTLAFYIKSNHVKHGDIVDIIFDQLLSKVVKCSRADLAVYIKENQKSVLFIIDGCDGDQINPTDNTAYGMYKKIKETSYCSQCPVVFTAGY